MSSAFEEHECKNIRSLLNELQDPFVMMPIQSAVTALKNSVIEIESNFNERMGPCGVGRRYWDVPTELLHEEKGYVIGNAFVMAQVAIDQAVIIFQKLREYCCNGNSLPKEKYDIWDYESEEAIDCSLNQIPVIVHVANYFKHRHEWQENWSFSEKDRERHTILAVQKIGMKPKYFTENMERALENLDYESDMNSIIHIIQLWRERLGEKILLELEKNGFVLPLTPKVQFGKKTL